MSAVQAQCIEATTKSLHMWRRWWDSPAVADLLITLAAAASCDTLHRNSLFVGAPSDFVSNFGTSTSLPASQTIAPGGTGPHPARSRGRPTPSPAVMAEGHKWSSEPLGCRHLETARNACPAWQKGVHALAWRSPACIFTLAEVSA